MLWLVSAALALGAMLWWFKRTRHPLLDLRARRIHTFLVGNAGAAEYRLVIKAVPFLLPLLFMVGFGGNALAAGLMIMSVFAGNVLIKPASSPLIRRFGFRRVLLLRNLGDAPALFACALLTSGTPPAVTAAVLFVIGVLRSIGFSAYNTVQFVDVPKARMAGANTLSSTIAQDATGLGVAVGALILRAAEALLGGDVAAFLGYQWTFAVLGALLLYPLVEALRSQRAGGDEARVR